MLRVIGMIAIFLGCTGIGYSMKQRVLLQIEHIKSVRFILKEFVSEMRYHKAAFAEACRIIGEKSEQPFKNILIHISEEERKNTGVMFGTIWKNEFQKAAKEIILNHHLLLGLEDLFLQCYENPETQQEKISILLEETEGNLTQEEKDSRNKGKLYLSMGAAGGLIGIILLL